MESLFTLDNGLFLPTDWTFGGWDAKNLHGSPCAVLLAYGLGAAAGDGELLLSRLTVDLLRPVPQAPLRLSTSIVREGRRIKLIDGFLHDGEQLVCRASALFLRRTGSVAGESVLPATAPIPRWQDAPPRHWDEGDAGIDGNWKFYHRAVEVRRLVEPHSGTPMRAWMRCPFELLPGRPLNAVERAASVSDFASATGMLSRKVDRRFINADIALALHREPVGEWILLDGTGCGDRDGVASSSVNLHDEHGLFGHSVVTCLTNDARSLVPARTASLTTSMPTA